MDLYTWVCFFLNNMFKLIPLFGFCDNFKEGYEKLLGVLMKRRTSKRNK